MSLKSIIFSTRHQTQTEHPTDIISLPFSHTLSTLRGGNFFTSAYSLPINGEGVVFLRQAHYSRLQYNYQQIYARYEFPLSEAQFNQTLDRLLRINPQSGQSQLQIIVVVCGGTALYQGTREQNFSNGFEGDIDQVLFIAQDMAIKPPWSFKSGINIITYPHQRPSASTKPTLYKAGISGQWRINYENVRTLLSQHYNDTLHEYSEFPFGDTLEWLIADKDGPVYHAPDLKQDFDIDELTRQMSLSREVRLQNIPFLSSYSFHNTPFDTLIQKWISDTKRPEITTLESNNITHIIHDVVFISEDRFILEGSTFSILALDEDLSWAIIPPRFRSGEILESISITFIKAALETAGIPFNQRPIHCDEIPYLKGLFAISSTRIMYNTDNTISLQCIRNVNKTPIANSSDIYHHDKYLELVDALQTYKTQYLTTRIHN